MIGAPEPGAAWRYYDKADAYAIRKPNEHRVPPV